MTDTPETAPVEVTQADRALFKMIITGMAGSSKHNAIDRGGFDTDERMQLIARLRAELSALPNPDADVIARLVGAYDAAVAFIESHAADPDLTDEMVRTYAEYQRTRREYLTAAQRQSVSPQGDGGLAQ